MNKIAIPLLVVLIGVFGILAFSTATSAANQSTTYTTVYVMNTLPDVANTTASPDPAVPSDTMTVTVNVNDVNGDLDKVWAVYYNTSGSAVGTVWLWYNATSGLYQNSTFTLPVDAASGTWNVTVYANDTYGTSQDSDTFTVGTVVAMTLHNTPVDFGNTSVGVNDRRAENGTAVAGSYQGIVAGFPLVVNNTGNANNNYTISGTKLPGQTDTGYDIGAGNITYDLTATLPGTALTGADALFSGNNAPNSEINLYFWIDVPAGIQGQCDN